MQDDKDIRPEGEKDSKRGERSAPEINVHPLSDDELQRIAGGHAGKEEMRKSSLNP